MNQETIETNLIYRMGKIKHDRYWIERPDSRMFQIDSHSKHVIERLANNDDIASISSDLDVSKDDIGSLQELLGLELGSTFVLMDSTTQMNQPNKTTFHIPWLERQWFNWGIITLIALSISCLALFMLQTQIVFVTSLKDLWIITGALTLSVLIHELGHFLTMPRDQNISLTVQWSGPVPLLSINCNEAWKLSKYQRIRINIAGFVADIFVCGLVAMIGILYPSISPWLWTFLIVHMFRMVFAIWPLLPGDGYWMLVDLFDQPNLSLKATEQLKQFKVNLLSFYGLTRTIFLITIWCLYAFVIYTWGTTLIKTPLEEALKILLQPAAILISLSLLNQFYVIISFVIQLIKGPVRQNALEK